MKRALYFIVLIFLFCLSSCFSNPKKHREIMETYLEGYKLLNVREGNFIPGIEINYLAFYSEIYEIEGVDYSDINKIILFSFKGNKPKKVITIPKLGSSSYESVNKEVKISNYADSEWDGFCFAADYNKNGIDEFVFFVLTGMSFHVGIHEFSENEGVVIDILEGAYKEINGIYKINTIQEDGKDYVMLYGYGRNLPEGHLKWNKCEWSEGKGQYILIDHGSEYFEF